MNLTFNLQKEIKEVIDTNLLLLWGGVFKQYDKGEYIFHEGQHPHFYHQVVKGRIKMLNETEDGRDFIQGFFSRGQSFGEPPLFVESEYPSSAMAVTPSTIIRLNIPVFKKLLQENFEVHWEITRMLSQRMIDKAKNLREISCFSPEHRVIYVLEKNKNLQVVSGKNRVKIDYTRQQIAEMTGLRVETVIRILRSLFEKNILTIEKGKVYY